MRLGWGTQPIPRPSCTPPIRGFRPSERGILTASGSSMGHRRPRSPPSSRTSLPRGPTSPLALPLPIRPFSTVSLTRKVQVPHGQCRRHQFWSGARPVFNAENIFINVTNSLAQGQCDGKGGIPADQQRRNPLGEGDLALQRHHSNRSPEGGRARLRDKDGWAQLLPAGRRRTRGCGTDGAAIVAMASLLKITVDQNIGIGNAARDLLLRNRCRQ